MIRPIVTPTRTAGFHYRGGMLVSRSFERNLSSPDGAGRRARWSGFAYALCRGQPRERRGSVVVKIEIEVF